MSVDLRILLYPIIAIAIGAAIYALQPSWKVSVRDVTTRTTDIGVEVEARLRNSGPAVSASYWVEGTDGARLCPGRIDLDGGEVSVVRWTCPGLSSTGEPPTVRTGPVETE